MDQIFYGDVVIGRKVRSTDRLIIQTDFDEFAHISGDAPLYANPSLSSFR